MNVAEAREYIKDKYGWFPAPSTLPVWISRGRLEAKKLGRGKWEITTDALDAAVISKSGHKTRAILDTVSPKAMKTLSPREKLILLMHAGIGGFQHASLADIGDELGVTRQYIHQVKNKALRKLAGD